jgi:hypothetical protein
MAGTSLAIAAAPSAAYALGHSLGAAIHYVGGVAGFLLLGRRLKNSVFG